MTSRSWPDFATLLTRDGIEDMLLRLQDVKLDDEDDEDVRESSAPMAGRAREEKEEWREGDEKDEKHTDANRTPGMPEESKARGLGERTATVLLPEEEIEDVSPPAPGKPELQRRKSTRARTPARNRNQPYISSTKSVRNPHLGPAKMSFGSSVGQNAYQQVLLEAPDGKEDSESLFRQIFDDDWRNFITVIQRCLLKMYNDGDMRFQSMNECAFKGVIIGALHLKGGWDNHSMYGLESEIKAFETKPGVKEEHADLLLYEKQASRGREKPRAIYIELKFTSGIYIRPMATKLATLTGERIGQAPSAKRAYTDTALWKGELVTRELLLNHAPADLSFTFNKDKKTGTFERARAGSHCVAALRQAQNFTEFKVPGVDNLLFRASDSTLCYAGVIAVGSHVYVTSSRSSPDNQVFCYNFDEDDMKFPPYRPPESLLDDDGKD